MTIDLLAMVREVNMAESEAERTALLDTATMRATAFESWAEFLAAVRAGYTPTLWPTSAERVLLRGALHAADLPVWP
jgi:hypothetical protein